MLEVAAGAPSDLKDDEEAWHVWWYDTLGYSYQSPPQVTLVQDASPSQLPPPYITTCFVAGTPVRTLDGPRPIEAIQVGDQVLSQDATTGALGFQSVVFLHHNPPGKTLRVSLSNGESLVCSVYHRFWRANVGWTMARELKPGDSPPHPRRPGPRCQGRARLDPAALQPRRLRPPQLLRRREQRTRPRQHAPRSSAQAVRRAARRGGAPFQVMGGE